MLALAVDRLAERVDDAAEHAVADGHREDAAGGLDGLALLDPSTSPSTTAPIELLVEVEGEADGAVLELEQLVDGGSRAGPTDAGDAVADLGDAADGAGLERRLEAVEVLLERRGDVGGAEGEFCHGDVVPSQSRDFSWSRRVRTVPSMTVSPTVATRPPSTDGSTTTLRLTLLAGGVGERGARGGPAGRR